MRLSLATRSLLGYALVIVLLGTVATYAIVAMDRMRHQVSVMRQDLLPAGARLQQISRETASYHAALQKARTAETGWVRQVLRAYRPFPRLEKVSSQLRRAGDSLAEGETLTVLAQRLEGLSGGHTLAMELVRVPGALQEPVLPWLDGMATARNDAVLEGLVERCLASLDAGAGPEPWLELVLVSLKALQRDLRTVHGDLLAASERAWEAVEARERNAVLAAAVLGGGSLLVSVLLSLLALRWLAPIRRLRALADRIARGQYDGEVQVRSGTELGDLAEDLVRMAGKLRRREEMIRRQAEELLRSERLSAIGKMSTQIAHEIRNPLNAIGLRLEILEETVGELATELPAGRVEELHDLTGLLTREVERLAEVTEYYLRFAKFPHPQKEPMDLASLVTDLVVFFQEEARAAGATLEWEAPPSLPLAADANLLRQALMNLVKNALEALALRPPPGGGRVQLKAWEEEGLARLRIRDNGPGIPPEARDRIFEPFFTTKEAGTGLGLTLVQQIIREHGGELALAGGAGEGTTFLVSLPLGSTGAPQS
ncbi:MAG: HAMP domain-containing protein [Deltaproteobacteria bacterium]|nr:HAMP domain-containing protein [Deltaproteobacteria bacterium]